jgi:hypothetical protein
MGTLKEADAPDVADDGAEEKEDAEVIGIADVEVDDGAGDSGGVPMLEELDEK